MVIMLDYFICIFGVDILDYYFIIGGVCGWNWNVGSLGNNNYINVGLWIFCVMCQNFDFEVFVVQGYYDLVIFFFVVELMFNQLGFVQDWVIFIYYEVGYMMYIYEFLLEIFIQDV